LAPALLSIDQTGEESVLDRLAAMRGDPLHEVTEARTRGRTRGGELVVHDDVEDRGQVVTAETRGPAQSEEAGVVDGGVPSGLPGPVLVFGRRCGQAHQVAGEPRAQARAELRLRGGVTKVHRQLPAARAPARGAARRRRRTTGTTATRAAGTRGRCTPT